MTRPFAAMAAALSLMTLGTFQLSAAPPPPIIPPPGLPEAVDGYDMRGFYQRWWLWVEGSKGAAADALLAKAETLEGETAFGGPLLRFRTVDYDLGHVASGEIRTFCRPSAKAWVPETGTCHHRLRRITVEHPAAVYGDKDNPVSVWTAKAFDSKALTRHLRASGIEPGDAWSGDKARIFAGLPSPVPMLIENATVMTVDSRDCPGLGEAIGAVEKSADLTLDLRNVGEDAEPFIPSPHSVITSYTLGINLPRPGGYASIEGSGPAFERLMRPVINAATYCDKQGRRNAG